MPIPVDVAMAESGDLAAAKAGQVKRTPGRFLLNSMLAGAYVGVAVVLLISVSASLVAAKDPMAKLVQGSVFGVALTLVVFFIWTYAANQATNNWTTIPNDWEQLRRQWEYSHAANAVVTFAAFCSVALSSLMARK